MKNKRKIVTAFPLIAGLDVADEIKALTDERIAITARIAEIGRRIVELCNHEWQWHQVAGEGMICRKCGARNFDCDD